MPDHESFRRWCNSDCAFTIVSNNQEKHREAAFKQVKRAIKKKEKAIKKVYAEEKRIFKQSDLKTRKAAAKKACHDYIKQRDLGSKCICCHRELGNNYDSGHWLESGNNPKIRYHEDNINSQSVYCNRYKGGDSGDYEKNLRLKIGNDKVDWLLTQKGGTVKRSPSEYKEIETYYKNKLKELS